MKTNSRLLNLKICVGLLLVILVSCEEKSIPDQIAEKKKEISEIQAEITKLQEQDTTAKKTNYPIVEVKPLKVDTFKSFIEVHGVVSTDQNISVVPEITGTIRSIKVSEGQRVKKGTLLAVLDTKILNTNLSELETQLELATDLYEKQQSLRKQDIGTEVQFLEAKNRKESLEKSIESLKAQRSQAYVTAPISGEIDAIYPNEGEMASPGQPMFRIVNLDKVYLEAEISEAYLGKIEKGKTVQIKFPSLGEEWVNATVSYVGNYINPGNRTFTIHVSPNKMSNQYLPNLLGVIKLLDYESEKAVVVPDKVIQDDGKSAYVFTVDKNNVAHKRNIKTGPAYKGSVLVKEGLSAGDRLVTKGQTLIVDSSQVKIN